MKFFPVFLALLVSALPFLRAAEAPFMTLIGDPADTALAAALARYPSCFDAVTAPTAEPPFIFAFPDGNQPRRMVSEALRFAASSAQLTGWLRTSDVAFGTMEATVEVSVSARTVDIVRDGVAERIADDFGWGTDATPTPIGRAFIHLSEVTSFAYTRGHPMVYLSLQSPTLDGFGGESVAVTAFHYHDHRSGAISNGCLRMAADAITRLGELPVGTGVIIRP